MRAVIISFVFFLTMVFGALAQDCDCGKPPYVNYDIADQGEDLELVGDPWRVAVITHYDVDLTQAGEPEVCEVKLDLIDQGDPILRKDFILVPDGDFEVNYQGKWMLASQFEAEMVESDCLTTELTS